MEVAVACQVPGTYHVAVKPPELFHLRREGPKVQRCVFSLNEYNICLREEHKHGRHCYRVYFWRIHFHLEDCMGRHVRQKDMAESDKRKTQCC